MTRSLDHSTILIIAGRSLSTFLLRKNLEDQGAAVSLTRLADVGTALRHVRPDAVIVDFSLATNLDGVSELEQSGIPHVVCRSPNKFQDIDEQVRAAQHVTAALAEMVEQRQAAQLRWQEPQQDIDRELYSI